ncbi:MAG TPA: Mur ligase family protein [Candidatus Acidoferrum sp.]|nr:Mur ligase family protein [Candidatus Acidoferrum sp.]
MTALAFDYFARCDVDIAVIEVGLGGRLDATNILHPELTIITDISYDHVEILGTTLRKIAREKAGIIRSGVPNLIGQLPNEAENVIRETCRSRRAPLFRLTRSAYRIHRRELQLDFHSPQLSIENLAPALIGIHQLRNCALALQAASLLREQRLKLSASAIKRGIETTSWPGRFQLMRLFGGPQIVLDVGHNTGGVAAFAESFRLKFKGRKANMIVGFVQRKRHQEMFDALADIAQSHTLVPLKTKRSANVRELLATIDWRGVPVTRGSNVSAAYERLAESSSKDDIIVIIGSHYLVGEFLQSHGRK